MKIKTLSITLLLAVSGALQAADVDPGKLPPASDKKDLTYEKDIKPIFEKSCFKCHGPEKQKAKLRLDSVEAAIKGGENGPDIIKGQSAKSPLVHAISAVVEDEKMPPDGKGDPLSKEKIGLIRAWIDQGAK
jgi:hypothetical protein